MQNSLKRSFFRRKRQPEGYSAKRQSDPAHQQQEQKQDHAVSNFDADTKEKIGRCSSKTSSILSIQSNKSGRHKRSSSVARSTASSVSVNPIDYVNALPEPRAFPAPDLLSGTRNYTDQKSVQIFELSWKQWDTVSAPFSVNKAGRQSTPCCFSLQTFLRGQALFRVEGADPLRRRGCMPLFLVENPAPGFELKRTTAYSTWVEYFDRTYPGWDWSKPDWRGQNYIALQQNRLCSDLELFDLRYSKWRSRVQIYGFKLRVK